MEMPQQTIAVQSIEPPVADLQSSETSSTVSPAVAPAVCGSQEVPHEIANLTYLLEQGNYGQRLQLFALQRYMEKEFGVKVVTLDSNMRRHKNGIADDSLFHRFERECLNLLRPDELGPDTISGFERIVVGGDQVLNTDWGTCSSDIFPYIYKRSAPRRNVFFYGAGLPASHSVKQQWLDRLSPHVIAYGLREDCRNIHDYVKVLDPVFLIYDGWGDVIRGRPVESGVLTYRVRSGHTHELSLATPSGVQSFPVYKTSSSELLDPREFVGLFSSADVVRTNSFHAFAFAIINRVERIECDCINDHRIKNLISMLHIRFDGTRIANYHEVFDNIERERVRSREFIRLCLTASPEDWFVYSKDADTRRVSTSGGFCAEAARLTYAAGGVVYGAAFTDGFTRVSTVRTTSMDEYLTRLSKSKYSFCRLPRLSEVKADVDSGLKVLFIGAPCQISAVRRYLGRDYSNLTLVDLRCRGYSHPNKLALAVADSERAVGSPVSAVDFRPEHRIGTIRVQHDSGVVTTLGGSAYKAFVFDSVPMCKRCQFAHGTASCADVTVGDCWVNSGDRLGLGVEFTPERGCNIVSVNTRKGADLFTAALPSLVAVNRLEAVKSSDAGIRHDLVVMCDSRRKSALRNMLTSTGESGLTMVEIGSYAGESAEAFLSSGAVQRLYCVDPWVDGYDPHDIASSTASAAERVFDARFSDDGRVVKVKGTIDDFVSRFQGAVSVDCVYIDACNTFNSVFRDILAARYALRPRLFIAGHDYSRRWSGVCAAVNAVFGKPDKVLTDKSWVVYNRNWGSPVAEAPGAKASVVHESMWDRFDMVIALVYTGYPKRKQALMAELARVGLADRAELFWSCPSPFDARFARSLRLHGSIRKPSHFNEVFGHYRAMKIALELGKKSVLILEDDVRFLGDVDTLASGIQSIPDDYDIAKLEWFCRGNRSAVGSGAPWARISGFSTTGGAAIAYSQRGLRWKVRAMERAAHYDDFHGLLYVNDAYETSGNMRNLKAYVATPLLAIQDPSYYHTSNYGIRAPNPYGRFTASGGSKSYGCGRHTAASDGLTSD